LCSRLVADFERKEVLYLAGLFHDIAKGRGGDHSVLGAAEARRFCRAHALPPEDVELVSWLVAQHLLMSATAQKQDTTDPDVVAAFAAKIGNERRLVALYLLSVADIRGRVRASGTRGRRSCSRTFLRDAGEAHGCRGQRHARGQPFARQAEARRLLRLYAVPRRARILVAPRQRLFPAPHRG
jgi:[protein-PII] uridylyltransferase